MQRTSANLRAPNACGRPCKPRSEPDRVSIARVLPRPLSSGIAGIGLLSFTASSKNLIERTEPICSSNKARSRRHRERSGASRAVPRRQIPDSHCPLTFSRLAVAGDFGDLDFLARELQYSNQRWSKWTQRQNRNSPLTIDLGPGCKLAT